MASALGPGPRSVTGRLSCASATATLRTEGWAELHQGVKAKMCCATRPPLLLCYQEARHCGAGRKTGSATGARHNRRALSFCLLRTPEVIVGTFGTSLPLGLRSIHTSFRLVSIHVTRMVTTVDIKAVRIASHSHRRRSSAGGSRFSWDHVRTGAHGRIPGDQVRPLHSHSTRSLSAVAAGPGSLVEGLLAAR